MTNFAIVVKRHPVAAYFLLALGISWLVELPLALRAQGVIAVPIPFALHYLAAFGPLVASLSMTALLDGRPGLRALLRRGAPWRVGVGWLLVSVGSPILLFAIAAVASYGMTGNWPDLSQFGEVSFLGDLGGIGALLLWIVTFGFGEETGWRGFALPHLQRRYRALGATLIVATFWGLWHVPMFFYVPSYEAMGLAGVPGFAIGLLVGAILLTWLYNSTGGSIFVVATWHALYDLASASPATTGPMNAVISMAVLVWVIVILVTTGLDTLSSSGKVAT